MRNRQLAVATITLGAFATAAQSAAITQTDLYSFPKSGAYGDSPISGLVADTKGNLYGVAGTAQLGAGNVFELTAGGQFIDLHDFSGQGCDNGSATAPSLSVDAEGNVWGGTVGGGHGGCVNGAIWKVSASGTFSVVYAFPGGAGGTFSEGALAFDSAGNAYGAATLGGQGPSPGNGLIFKISPGGTESTVYSFSGPDGANPTGVILDRAGDLVGTTGSGGANNFGALFRLSLGTGREALLYSFTANTTGGYPTGVPVEDNKGNFFGSTYDGNTDLHYLVWRVSASGTETVVYKSKYERGDDFQTPLAVDPKGFVFVPCLTAAFGPPPGRYGSIDRIAPGGKVSAYYQFARQPGGGAGPNAPIVIGADGMIYGTTQSGGANGEGVIFKLSPR